VSAICFENVTTTAILNHHKKSNSKRYISDTLLGLLAGAPLGDPSIFYHNFLTETVKPILEIFAFISVVSMSD